MTNNISPADDAKPAASWAQWFDRCADYYQDPRMKMSYYKNGKTGEPVSTEELHAIHADVWNKLHATKESIILDVGSGIGLFIQAYQDRVQRIVGTDISFNMMKDALAINPQGSFLQCNVDRLPFVSNAFDRVLCYSVFHYLGGNDQAKKTLDEFSRVVKRGGQIFIGDLLFPEKIDSGDNLIDSSPSRKSYNFLEGEKPVSPLKTPDSKHTQTTEKNQWWPSCLNHSLQKKTFAPAFFMNYCKENKYDCQILNQNIPSKITASSRYDIVINFQ